jgi:hypothetical protein
MFTSFVNDETGAVTVDWVVLTGAVIGLGVAVMTSVGTGSTTLADLVETTLTDSKITAYMAPGAGEELRNNIYGGITSCPPPGQGPPCQRISYYSELRVYAMSDGSEWTHQVYSTGDYHKRGTVTRDTWQDGEGNFVDPPEGFAG